MSYETVGVEDETLRIKINFIIVKVKNEVVTNSMASTMVKVLLRNIHENIVMAFMDIKGLVGF